MTSRRFPRPRLWVASRESFCRRQKHTSDQNAERDVVETVRENMQDGRPFTLKLAWKVPTSVDTRSVK